MAKRPSRPKSNGRPSLRAADTTSLLGELQRRAEDLEARRRALRDELDRVEAELAQIQGAAEAATTAAKGSSLSRVRGGRLALPALVEEILRRGGQMSIGEIADAARAAGHKSASANFNLLVNDVLRTDRDRYERVYRGVYRLRDAPRRAGKESRKAR